MPTESGDLDLLRRFEPVLRFTRGERFFPMQVGQYLSECSMWINKPDGSVECLVNEGHLNEENLTQQGRDGFDSVTYLQFIEPLNVRELATYRIRENILRRDPAQKFHAGRGRLARVGYIPRFIDALFSLTLLARGRVPGDAATSAVLTYQRMMEESEHYQYYGRIIRQRGWITLQYWFFYPFNNWRSGFYGANDHEADWEMISIFLYEQDGEILPEWIAYASHEFSGDDIRRRWDDPEVFKVGEHPVVYVGAGSHASYYQPGEYISEVELAFLSPLVRLVEFVQESWRKTVRKILGGNRRTRSAPSFNVFKVPFVDYARGDGAAIGHGLSRSWDVPQLIDDSVPWVTNYRGLWGYYARDPVSGENAPAGPRYNRNGGVRKSWYDPLGWAGLDKVLPPGHALEAAYQRTAEIQSEILHLSEQIEHKGHLLLDLGLEARAMHSFPHMRQAYHEHQKRIVDLTQELDRLREDMVEAEAALEALQDYLVRLESGDRGPLRAHIEHAHSPEPPSRMRLNRVAEVWAAASIGLMLISFVGVVLFARQVLVFGLAAWLSLLIFIEAGFRRRLEGLIRSATILLAIFSTLVLMYEFFWEIIVAGVLLAGGYIMWENLSELWS